MIPSGFVALLAGWFTTEIGRQPYVVYGMMRTAEAVSAVPGASVATTLALFVGVYGGIFGAGIYYIVRLIRKGPLEIEPAVHGTPARPMSVADEPLEESRA
jgi:cytochrome d ubiquinol oxidase subunit I